jgi:hypothetical protein
MMMLLLGYLVQEVSAWHLVEPGVFGGIFVVH